jgi:dihydrofolate reductase
MNISFIVAVSENNVIGLNGKMPWHIPQDLRHFKNKTLNHTVVMGRKTFDAIGHPLNDRKNIILTSDTNLFAAGCIVTHTVEQCLDLLKKENGEIFVIGGTSLFQLFMPYVNKIYLTKIHAKFEGDTFFPELNSSEWIEVNREHHHNQGFSFDFIELKKSRR